MKNLSIVNIGTYRAAMSVKMIEEHLAELIAKRTKVIQVGDASIISIRNTAGLTRHSLPIMLQPNDPRNNFGKNVFFLDTYGLKAQDIDFRYMATLLTAIWEDPSINESFFAVNRLALSLYGRWIAGGFNRRFGIDYADQNAVSVVIALYYILQGEDIQERDFNLERISKIIRMIADSTNVKDDVVKNVMMQYDLIKDGTVINYQWLMETLPKVCDILKYRMNDVTAMSVVSGSWYPNDVASPQLAMNYKPYFIAMLYTAFSDRNAGRTGLDSLIKNVLEGRRRDQADGFVRAIDGIIKEQVTQ